MGMQMPVGANGNILFLPSASGPCSPVGPASGLMHCALQSGPLLANSAMCWTCGRGSGCVGGVLHPILISCVVSMGCDTAELRLEQTASLSKLLWLSIT